MLVFGCCKNIALIYQSIFIPIMSNHLPVCRPVSKTMHAYKAVTSVRVCSILAIAKALTTSQIFLVEYATSQSHCGNESLGLVHIERIQLVSS